MVASLRLREVLWEFIKNKIMPEGANGRTWIRTKDLSFIRAAL